MILKLLKNFTFLGFTPLKCLLLILLAAIYVYFGYFLERENFLQVVLLFGVGFALYFFLILNVSSLQETNTLVKIAVVFRLIFIVATPCLSDDYFRFIWDGRLLVNGLNPYLFLPSEIINTNIASATGLTEELYKGLNSPHYYTVYPPVNQLFFALGGFFSQFGILAGIIAIRIPIIIGEILLLIGIKKLLKYLQLPQYYVLWYALNPLVIVELSGNLHFEGMMLLFVVGGIYWLMQKRWKIAAFCWAFAIGTKLIPLLFLPVFIKQLGLKNSTRLYLLVAMVLVAMFIPFVNQQLVEHLFSSINLYFQTFEFNASVYYLIRWLGIQSLGYNIIQQAGPVLAVLTMVFVMGIYFYKSGSWELVLKKMLLAYTVYLLLATTVHPWYIINLILLSVFVPKYRFAIIWSVLVVLSYAAYQSEVYEENMGLIALEYCLVIGWGLYEMFRKNTTSLKKLSR